MSKKRQEYGVHPMQRVGIKRRLSDKCPNRHVNVRVRLYDRCGVRGLKSSQGRWRGEPDEPAPNDRKPELVWKVFMTDDDGRESFRTAAGRGRYLLVTNTPSVQMLIDNAIRASGQ